ncbi:hypothetical protein [Streptomyces sp. SD31]|uniref:hypothetical protein n=1 Tax=Streptomyces sp. SD31 TaxID=3452208 RepID=UPI003F8868B8
MSGRSTRAPWHGAGSPHCRAGAGEGIDLIDDVPSAADLVGSLAAQAEEALNRAGGR